MGRDLAIDLGTANTLVFVTGRGIVLNEPTVIALNREKGQVLAMGQEAYRMIGRTPGYIVAERPLRRGAITDFEVTERYIRLILERAGVRKPGPRPRGVIFAASAGACRPQCRGGPGGGSGSPGSPPVPGRHPSSRSRSLPPSGRACPSAS